MSGSEIEKEVEKPNSVAAGESQMNMVDIFAKTIVRDDSTAATGGASASVRSLLPELGIDQGHPPKKVIVEEAPGAVLRDLGKPIQLPERDLTLGKPLEHDHTQEQLANVARGIDKAIGQLPKELQEQYAALKDAKGGNYSNDQLAFIKQHLGRDAYTNAQTYNEINTSSMLDRVPNNLRPAEIAGPKQNLATVYDSVAKLPEKLQDKFGELKSNKDGSFSDAQLSFLKEHCGKKAYSAAAAYNDFVHGYKEIPGPGKKPVGETLPGAEPAHGMSAGEGSAARDAKPASASSSPEENAREAGNGKVPRDAKPASASSSPEETSREARDGKVPRTGSPAEAAADAARDSSVPRTSGSAENSLSALEVGKAKTEAVHARGQVEKALKGLDPVQAKAYDQLEKWKSGSYSNQQLEFIKEHLPKDVYQAAQKFNKWNEQNLESMHQQRERFNNPEMSDRMRLQYKQELVKSEALVNKAVDQMKPALQEMFKELKSNKDGTYSQEQLKFLKDYSKEGYMGAARYNAAWNSLMDMSRKAETGTEKLKHAVEKEAGSGKEKHAVDKESAFDKEKQAVEKESGKLKEVEGGKLEKAKDFEQLTKALLKQALDSLRNLPADQVKAFKNLPLNKDGIGYNKMHVDYLRKYAGHDAAQAMESHIQHMRFLLESRIPVVPMPVDGWGKKR